MKDDGFVDRALKASVAAAVFVAWFLLALGRVHEAASFALGAALSVGFMAAARLAVWKATTPGRPQGRRFAVLLAAAKYGVAAVAIWHFVHWRNASMLSFVAGAGITQLVLVMKAAGQIAAPPEGRLPLREAMRRARQARTRPAAKNPRR
ncbi:MAG TPA: hypothetical protein VGM37_05965 [Armatimonadota bacterium]